SGPPRRRPRRRSTMLPCASRTWPASSSASLPGAAFGMGARAADEPWSVLLMAWPFTPQQRGRFRSGSPFLQGPVEPGKSFDGAELLRNVQRMLTDNDRLKKELNDKVARIEAQN